MEDTYRQGMVTLHLDDGKVGDFIDHIKDEEKKILDEYNVIGDVGIEYQYGYEGEDGDWYLMFEYEATQEQIDKENRIKDEQRHVWLQIEKSRYEALKKKFEGE